MQDLKIFDAEYKFLDIIWSIEPINSTKLTKICLEKLGWKKSTTYTVLNKLCERGILKNEDATVTALINREQVQKHESETLLDKSFDGSLPVFLAAFLKGKKISQKEAEEIKKMIEEAAK
ncbi:MAG: BlaI/MecI/CopY family transcriptional regulator [Oscillospiraceae bacterium]|jgi:predicted transcriptional regulator|nr:BlaI/MecI/CopY family transcriptional regulator [Oscillospiraceae bacterium]